MSDLEAWTFVLWDVDNTLIDTSGVSKKTYTRAFELLVARPPRVAVETAGRTDFEIMSHFLCRNDVEETKFGAEKFAEVLTAAMVENRDELRSRGHALPGAREALAALYGKANVVQSVLTGNIPHNAYEKLAAFGLDAYVDFEVGGFGTDHIVRARLVDAARRKALHKYGIQFDRTSTVLIGDTPRDVQAGRDGGARVLAVATGKDTVTELRDAGADTVLPDLEDTAEVLKALVDLRV